MNKVHRILSILLCLCLLVCTGPSASAMGLNSVIRISSLEAFLEFAENCRIDSYSQGKTFRLTADIDLTGTDFDGIPIFCGTFEGADHVISGLSVTSAGSAKGLFRYIQDTATVRDLKVEGTVAPTGSRSQVGGIAGSNAGVIENCSFSGTVSGAEDVGGIAGVNLAGGAILDCTAEGTVSGKHFAGGITGKNNGTVRSCTNLASINATPQQNDIDISDITLDSLLDTESAAAATDIGGIAGFSDGTLIACVNRGVVGYPHMSYNVGGIVGLQVGYVASCANYGAVSGRKEVGGIVGQQEPEVVLRYSTDTVQILQAQISVLSDLVDRAVANGNANVTYIRNLLYKMERYAMDAEDASDYLKDSLQHPKLSELESYADAIQTIRDSIQGINNTLRSLWDAMEDTASDLNKDMTAISGQLAVIEGTLSGAENNLGGGVFDVSDQDTAEDLGSKLESCQNFGAILGDLNVGGILGAVSFENDLDPEEDITVVGETSLNAIGSLRSVVLDCSNTGSVSAKYQRAGGIVGWLTMGLVKDCANTADVGSESADYAGGIAGESRGYIRSCKVKAHIVGDANVGGIAGLGAIATDCYAMALITGNEKTGGIFGNAAEPYQDIDSPIVNNYYLVHGTDYGAVDGISYEGSAKGLTLQQFLQQQTGCEILNYATVTFLADGEVVLQETLQAGAAFTAVPQVPEKAGYTGVWAELTGTELESIVFDLTFYASYTKYAATVQSEEVGANGRPLLLLQGDFASGAKVVTSALENLSAITDGQRLLQGLEYTVQNCVCLHTGRYLIPSGTDLDKTVLLVRDANGNWAERSYTVDESYIVFSLGIGDTGIALVESDSDAFVSAELLIAAGSGALAVLIVVLAVCLLRKRKKKAVAAQPEATEELIP